MSTPRYQPHHQPQRHRNGWTELAHWLFTSRWGVRLLLLIATGITLEVFWKTIESLALTGLTICIIIAIAWALVPKKAKKKL